MNFYNKIGVEYPDWQNCTISPWDIHNILDVASYRESWSNRFNKHNGSIDGDDNDDDNNDNNDNSDDDADDNDDDNDNDNEGDTVIVTSDSKNDIW